MHGERNDTLTCVLRLRAAPFCVLEHRIGRVIGVVHARVDALAIHAHHYLVTILDQNLVEMSRGKDCGRLGDQADAGVAGQLLVVS
jgi:hypothetical protein